MSDEAFWKSEYVQLVHQYQAMVDERDYAQEKLEEARGTCSDCRSVRPVVDAWDHALSGYSGVGHGVAYPTVDSEHAKREDSGMNVDERSELRGTIEYQQELIDDLDSQHEDVLAELHSEREKNRELRHRLAKAEEDREDLRGEIDALYDAQTDYEDELYRALEELEWLRTAPSDRATAWWEMAKFFCRNRDRWESGYYALIKELDELKAALRTLGR